MRPFVSLLAAAVLFILLPATAVADTSVVPVAGDTYVRSDIPTSNFGTADLLQVDGDPTRTALLYFPSTPSNVTSATLRINSRWSTHQPLNIRQISCAGWSETAVTYNSYQSVQKGGIVATIPDDPVGWLEVAIPADKINASFGGTSSNANCFAVEKPGDLWMNLAARENVGLGAQLVVETGAPPPPPAVACADGIDNDSDGKIDYPNDPGCSSATDTDETDAPPPVGMVDDCSGGAVVSATPSTLASAVASSSRVIVNAQPGTYGGFSRWPSSTQSCVKIKCTVAAKTGNVENSGGCRATGQWGAFGNIRNLTVEGFHFVTNDDYGLQFYNEDPFITGMAVRVADNVFHGNMDHDISTKSRVQYTEVLNNLFISCMRHCWEIGQNGNIRSRPSTAGTNLFRGNTVSSRIQGVSNRATVRLDVENNTFGSVAGYAVISQTYWAYYPFGASWDDGRLMVPGTLGVDGSDSDTLPDDGYTAPVPLRTNVTGNSFSSGNRMTFEGRGVIDDVVKIQGNSGTTPSCSRVNMPSGTASAHANEQTTAPPQLDPASDRAC